MAERQELPAGNFSSWLSDMRASLDGQRTAEVPCGSCTACCTSSQFIHIGPDEHETLARIPRELLFPAPGLPDGHRLLGYDERGHCPMLVDNRCSIYAQRPRTCRTYDCRIFAAAGVEPDDVGKAAIAERARRWRFEFPGELDRSRHSAVRAAAAYLRENADRFPDRMLPTNPTQLAVLAVQVHAVFLQHCDETGQVVLVPPDLDDVIAAVTRATKRRTG